MNKVRIALVTMGSLKYPLDINQLLHWESAVMTIAHGASIAHLANAKGDDWQYTDDQLLRQLSPDPNADITLGLINAPLQDNYYLRRLNDKVAILSLYEMVYVIRSESFTVENFVLRMAYELTVLFTADRKLAPASGDVWGHDDIRGCLFDMASSKADVVFSLHRPNLCQSCKARVLQRQVDPAFLPALERELPKIQKARYARIADWVKEHPIFAILVTAASGVTLNLIASVIFEKGRRLWPWIG